MRQMLPPERGYPIQCDDLGVTISPGEPFDHDVLVAGCVPLDGQGRPETAGAADGEDAGPGDGSFPHSHAGDQPGPATGGRKSRGKE